MVLKKKFNPNRARLEKRKRKGKDDENDGEVKKVKKNHDLNSKQFHDITVLLETMKKRFPTFKEKEDKANEAFAEMEVDLSVYSNNFLGSQALEIMIPLLSVENLQKCFAVYQSQVGAYCNEKCGGKTLQTVIKEAGKRSYSHANDEHKIACREAVLSFSKAIINLTESLITNTYGSHTLRSVLFAMSQLKDSKKDDQKILPEYVEILQNFGTKLFGFNKFKFYTFHKMGTETVKVTMKVLDQLKSDLLRQYIQTILKHLTLKMIFETPVATLVLETVLLLSNAEEHAQVYETFFKGKLSKTFYERNGSHIVTRILENIRDKETFKAIYSEFKTEFKKLVAADKLALLEILCRECKKQEVNQKEFMKRIRKAYTCRTEDKLDKFVICLATNTQFKELQETYDFRAFDLNIHGTVMIQLLCEYQDPQIVVNGFLAMPSEQLLALFANRKGCYMADSYFKSETIDREAKKRMFKKFRNMFKDLLKDEGGAKGFIAIWNGVDQSQKSVIAKELKGDESWLENDFGAKVAEKIHYELYKSDKAAWKTKIEEKPTVSLLKLFKK